MKKRKGDNNAEIEALLSQCKRSWQADRQPAAIIPLVNALEKRTQLLEDVIIIKLVDLALIILDCAVQHEDKVNIIKLALCLAQHEAAISYASFLSLSPSAISVVLRIIASVPLNDLMPYLDVVCSSLDDNPAIIPVMMTSILHLPSVGCSETLALVALLTAPMKAERVQLFNDHGHGHDDNDHRKPFKKLAWDGRVANTILRLIANHKITFSIIWDCFQAFSFRYKYRDFFEFTKLLFQNQYFIWAHDLFLLLMSSVDEVPFQLEICHYVIQNCEILGNPEDVNHTSNIASVQACWILHSLVLNTIQHSVSLNTHENNSLQVGLSTILLNVLSAQSISHTMHIEWQLKSNFLAATYVKTYTGDFSVLCSTITEFLLSNASSKRYIGVALFHAIMKLCNPSPEANSCLPFYGSLKKMMSLFCTLLSSHSLDWIVPPVRRALFLSLDVFPKNLLQNIKTLVFDYVKLTGIYNCDTLSKVKASDSTQNIFSVSQDCQPINIAEFSRRFLSKKSFATHALNLPYVLACICNLNNQLDSDCLANMLNGGFQIPDSSCPEDQHCIYLLIKSIEVHLVNIYFRKTNIVNPLLIHCVQSCMKINAMIESSTAHLQQAEKQILDDVFLPTEELDITLVSGVLLSIPPYGPSFHYQDSAERQLVGCIYNHFFGVTKHDLRFISLAFSGPRFDSISPLAVDITRLTTVALSHLSPPHTYENPACSLFQWLIQHTTALSNTICAISLSINTLVQQDIMDQVALSKIALQSLRTSVARAYNILIFSLSQASSRPKRGIEGCDLANMLLPLDQSWFPEVHQDLVDQFFSSRDSYLALMVLEAISCLVYSDLVKSISHTALFYLFLTTTYPTSSKELLPLFSHAISNTVFSSSVYWYEDTSIAGAGAWIHYAVVGLFSTLPSTKSLGILMQMSDSVGERVLLATPATVHADQDSTIVHYRGVSDEMLPQFMISLIHIAAKKIVQTLACDKDEILVLLQVTADLVSSYFDLSAYHPSQVTGTILGACHQVLMALKPKWDSCTNHMQYGYVYEGLRSIATKVKALIIAHEHKLDSLSAFAPLVQLCESFLLNATSPAASPLSFSPSYLQELHEHFKDLLRQVEATQYKPTPQNSEHPIDDSLEDDELFHEINRLRNG